MRIAAIVGASLAAASYAKPDAMLDPLGGVEADHFRPSRRGKGQNNRRGKGKRSPPKQRPNRLTISKRIRRKHRRAA